MGYFPASYCCFLDGRDCQADEEQQDNIEQQTEQQTEQEQAEQEHEHEHKHEHKHELKDTQTQQTEATVVVVEGGVVDDRSKKTVWKVGQRSNRSVSAGNCIAVSTNREDRGEKRAENSKLRAKNHRAFTISPGIRGGFDQPAKRWDGGGGKDDEDEDEEEDEDEGNGKSSNRKSCGEGGQV